MFTPCDKVVCVDDRFLPIDHTLFSSLPRQGRVYVVRSVHPDRGGVLLVGIQGIWSWRHGCEYHFKSRRFRRLEPLALTVSADLLDWHH